MRKPRQTALLLVVLVPGISGAVYGQFLNDPYVVANSGLEWWSDAAYNPTRNEYCMTWQNGYVIKWRRLDSTGAVLGSEYAIADGVTQGHHYSTICYNSARQEYLILYSGWIDGVGDHMRVLRVDATTGNQIGGTIWLDTIGTNSTTGGLDLAYSLTSNSYLAVYECYNDGNVYGRILDTYGNPTGSRIQIDTPSQLYSRNPVVAWNSVNNEYLVTYMGLGTGPSWDYWAQRIRASDGALLGSNLQISSTGDVYNYGGVAYDSNANRYLVVWDGNSSPPWGQLVSNTASLVGSRFPIGVNTSTGWAASVCYDSSKHEFLVSWSGNQTATNYSRRVSQGGVCIGDAFSNTGAWESVGIGNWPPRPVYNSVNDEFLIHWDNSYATILDRRYKSTPAPPVAPNPVTNFVAIPANGQNVLTWTNSSGSQTGTLIRFKTTGFPTSPTDGTQIYDGSGASYTHGGLTNGVNHYYTAWAHDATPNYATGVNASASPGVVIIPQPQELTWKTGTGFLVNGTTQIMANSAPDAREINMASQLQRKVWDMTGYLPAIVYGGNTTTNVIAVGDPARCPAVSSIIATWTEATGKAAKPEGYMLGVKDTSIVIRGFDNAGSFYGSQTLIQLLESFQTTRISPLFSYDYPELPWRGVYMRVKWEHDWKFTKELLSEVFARYKVNYFNPEIHMASVSHPEIPPPNENPVTLPSAQDMLNFTATHYINNIVAWYPGPPQGDTVPEECILGPGHIQKRTDLFNDDWNYLGNPPYVNVYESELSSLGCAAERSQYSNAWLFNTMLGQDYSQTYTAHGMQPVMFADMLRTDMAGGTMGTASVVATMPDIILADWEYGTPGNVPTDYPSLDRWIQYGRRAVGTPFGLGSYPAYNQYYGDKENIYYWANAVFNRRAAHPNLMLGLLAWNKYMANDRNLIVPDPWQQQCLGCYPYYAEWSWNPNGRYWNPYPYGNGWSMVLRELAPARVSNLTGTRSGSNSVLNWTNPGDSAFTAAYVVYRTDRYATSPIDGTYLADVTGSPGAAGTYTHANAPAVAYYSVFAHDHVRHFSPEATTKNGGYCFEDYFSYNDGALNGQGGWTGSAASEIQVTGQTVKITGGTISLEAARSGLNCSDPGTGFIRVGVKAHAGVGSDTSWALWIDDAAGTNIVRWYGSGTTARGRVGSSAMVTNPQTLTGSWDDLVVKIKPTTHTAEFFLNGASIGTLDYTSQSAGSVVGRVRFERIASAFTAGQFVSFDDLTIGRGDLPALAGQATNPNPANGASGVSSGAMLSWTAGTNANSHNVYFGTTTSPASRGSQTTTTFNPGLLTPGTTCYWRIDEVNNAGTTTGVLWNFTVSSQPEFSRMDFDQDGDVDQSDFGFLQRCLSDGVGSYSEGCAPADLNSDGSIDGLDFNLFQPCTAGPNRPPGC